MRLRHDVAVAADLCTCRIEWVIIEALSGFEAFRKERVEQAGDMQGVCGRIERYQGDGRFVFQ